MTKTLYHEVQYFRGNPLWTVLLLLPPVFFLGMLAVQVYTGQPVGDKPMSNVSLLTLTLFVLIPSIWAWRRVKLTLILDDEKISYGWNMPTADLNAVYYRDIKEWKVIKYGFVGYGYRLSIKYGTVHNLSGNKGLQIITKKGEKILVGTHRPEDLAHFISGVMLSS